MQMSSINLINKNKVAVSSETKLVHLGSSLFSARGPPPARARVPYAAPVWLISPGAWEKTHLTEYRKKSRLPNNASANIFATRRPRNKHIRFILILLLLNSHSQRGARANSPRTQSSLVSRDLSAVCMQPLVREQARDAEIPLVSNCKLCATSAKWTWALCTRLLKGFGWLCPQLMTSHPVVGMRIGPSAIYGHLICNTWIILEWTDNQINRKQKKQFMNFLLLLTKKIINKLSDN